MTHDGSRRSAYGDQHTPPSVMYTHLNYGRWLVEKHIIPVKISPFGDGAFSPFVRCFEAPACGRFPPHLQYCQLALVAQTRNLILLDPNLLILENLPLTPHCDGEQTIAAGESAMFKPHHLTSGLVAISLAAGIAAVCAAETGTKTFPTSSVYPPRIPPPVWGSRPYYRPVYNFAPRRHFCYLPTGRCNNQHRMQN
jgi:hypothetical protein